MVNSTLKWGSAGHSSDLIDKVILPSTAPQSCNKKCEQLLLDPLFPIYHLPVTIRSSDPCKSHSSSISNSFVMMLIWPVGGRKWKNLKRRSIACWSCWRYRGITNIRRKCRRCVYYSTLRMMKNRLAGVKKNKATLRTRIGGARKTLLWEHLQLCYQLMEVGISSSYIDRSYMGTCGW